MGTGSMLATNTRSGMPNANSGIPGDTSGYLNQVLPGFSGASSSAMGVINNLLNGLPSVDATRQSNAYFGAGSGMPGSDFVRNRGYDLYGQKAQANQQTGLQDLLSTIGGYSGTVVPTAGQSLQNTQFGQSLGEQVAGREQQGNQFGQTLANQKYEFGQNYQLNSFDAMLQALGLGNTITNTGQIGIPQTTLQ